AAAQVLQELPRPLAILGGAGDEVQHGVADGLAVAGQPEYASLARNGRLRLVVDEADVVVVQRAQVHVLARVERLARGNEAQVERVGGGQLLLEGALPPLGGLPPPEARPE